LNIEFDGFLNIGLAQSDFKESITTAENIFYRTNLYFYDCLPADTQVDRKEIYEALNSFKKANTEGMSGRDFIELWRYEFGDTKINDFDDACKFVYAQADYRFNWREYGDIIAYLLPADYDYHITRGYSQGDAEYVIYPKGYTTKGIDNLFWDTPFYAVLTVDGEELYFDEYVKTTYTWDKEEVMSIVKNHFDQAVYTWCGDNLPSQLEC
jgi:hypothetical protein